MNPLNTIQILLVVAHQGYQPIEYTIPKYLLEAEGIKVVTASNKPGVATVNNVRKSKYPITLKNGTTKKVDLLLKTKVDVTLDQVNPQDYDGIFFIGGPGAMENLDNKTSHDIIKKMAELNKPFGAICISPRILAKAGVLAGKKRATGWNDDSKLAGIFKKYDVKYIKEDVVVDGNIVTGTSPAAARDFGYAIIDVVKK